MEEQRNPNSKLFQHKGFSLIRGVHDGEHIDSVKAFEVREDDILVITYPKSGTTWMQYIISLMYHESEMTQGDEVTMKHVPWLEVNYPNIDFGRMSSPRTFVSHLPTSMVPDGFKRKGKVMYVSRNPKDVAVSFYHFHNVFKHLENKGDFGGFLQQYLMGQVFAGSGFDHVMDWNSHKDEFEIIFITYEEMLKDLKGTLVKMSSFFGKPLDAKTIDGIIEKSNFHNMKKNAKANYANRFPEYFDNSKCSQLRRGKVGDWKTVFTVEQSEMFDKVYQEKMKDIPMKFYRDL